MKNEMTGKLGTQSERVFSIELSSGSGLRNVNLSDGSRYLLMEGTIGSLKRAEFIEDSVLELMGTSGVLRVDLSRTDLSGQPSETSGERRESRNYFVGLWLDVILGLVGLFGVGDLYLGRWLRGVGFLAWTVGLYIALLLTIAIPGLAFMSKDLSVAWALGYGLLVAEISWGH